MASLKDDTGELSTVDNHLADSASGFVDREEKMAENHLVERKLQETNDALERIDAGTYGNCVDTGEAIPFDRLKAIPYAKRTIAAEEKPDDRAPLNQEPGGENK